jgi:hypothetical protein
MEKEFRRLKVAELLRKYGMLTRGTISRIARELHVHRCTIVRDVRALLNAEGDPLNTRTFIHCKACGTPIPTKFIKSLEATVAQLGDEEE